MTTSLPAPSVGLQTEIKPEWIDNNGHFNAGYYFVVFDDAVTDWMSFVGLNEAHRESNQVTTFSVEATSPSSASSTLATRSRFARNFLPGSQEVSLHPLHAPPDRGLAGRQPTSLMSMHISMETRRSAPMAPEILEQLGRIEQAHAQLPIPPQVGRVIGIKAGRAG